jgi:phage/plasmid-like protein (TIGR03299 family)
MPAEISNVNGKAEAFTALTPAWWDSEREYMTDQCLTSEQVWGERGLLNFKYSLKKLYDEKGVEIPDFRRTVREDTGVTVGCGMTDRYRIVQPRDALGWMDSLMMDGVMRYASAGVLHSGRQIWILGQIPDADKTPIVGERHDKYVLWTDRFDGGGTLKWFPCVTRVECANTLRIASGERNREQFQTIRHTGNIGQKLTAARASIIQAKEAFQKYNEGCLKLISTTYTRPESIDYIAQLFPAPIGTDGKEVLKGRVRTNWERKVDAVRDAYRHPSNQRPDMCGTWYQMLNSVTMAIDHYDIFRTRSNDKRTAMDNRFLSLMNGEGAELKEKAFNLALEMAV